MIKRRIPLILAVLVIVLLGIVFFLRSIYVVPIIMYHHIDENYENSKLSVSPESFKRQMEFLRRHNYNIISLHELVDKIKSGTPMSYGTIAVTFDDGYEDNYTNGFPVLRENSIPASIFVPVNKVGRKGYLTWKQLKLMQENNIEIGSHTLSECFLPDIKDEARLRREIFASREKIKDRMPEGGDFLAYCSGGFNDKVRELVIKAGYEGACATNPGKLYPKDDIFALKRLRISRTSDNMFVFWIETSGFYTWIKEIRDD